MFLLGLLLQGFSDIEVMSHSVFVVEQPADRSSASAKRKRIALYLLLFMISLVSTEEFLFRLLEHDDHPDVHDCLREHEHPDDRDRVGPEHNWKIESE